ncbi:hypothetical protein V8E36_008945 [Tilletia maclaganii]
MSSKQAGKRRADDVAASSGSVKRSRRQDAGSERLRGQRSAGEEASSSSTQQPTLLTDLPVELLYTIMILCSNPSLAIVNRQLHQVFQHTPPHIRAAYIVSSFWRQLGDILVPPPSHHRGPTLRSGSSSSSLSSPSLLPLFDPAFQRSVNDLCGGEVTIVPARIADPRELVHRRDLALITDRWSREGYPNAPSFWMRDVPLFWIVEGTAPPRRPELVTDPLGFVLRFPLCDSTEVLDAFCNFMARIPTFRGIVEGATYNDRLRTSRIVPRLVARLVPPPPSKQAPPSDDHRILPAAAETESTPSRLAELVASLGDRPRPPEAALRLFLRVLFWHYSAVPEMMSPPVVLEASATGPSTPTPNNNNTSSAPPALQRFDIPILRAVNWPLAGYEKRRLPGRSISISFPISDKDEIDDALLQSAVDRNLWALRLLRRFSRPVYSKTPEDSDPVRYLISDGWVEGLRYMLRAESPDDALLESRVCAEIAVALWEEGILGPKRSWASNDDGDTAAEDGRHGVSAAERGASGALPSFFSQTQQAGGGGAAESEPELQQAPGAQAPLPLPTQVQGPPPTPVVFARTARVVDPSYLTYAVAEGQFEVVEYLMKEHGLTPDMATLRALERLRVRARRNRQSAAAAGAVTTGRVN